MAAVALDKENDEITASGQAQGDYNRNITPVECDTALVRNHQVTEDNDKSKKLDTDLESVLECNSIPEHTENKKDIVKEREIEEFALDEVDKMSIFSFYMEKDFQYYFQHPYFRLFIAYFVTFCNFLIYAEDPVAHSQAECFIPVVGNAFAMVCTRYPSNAWSVLKVMIWLAAIILGMLFGKLVIHRIIFNKLFKLQMFNGKQGSWMTMFFTVIIFIFLFSLLYTALLLIGGDSTKEYHITQFMGIRNSQFMKAAACGTWCGDLFTAWMVTDVMLQEKLYPKWGVMPRKWWNTNYNRIIMFWVICLTLSVIVVTVIVTDWISWDRLNHDFLPTNEISRGFLASFVLVMDLMIIMQDWDFPHFISTMDIKLPGLNTYDIKFEIPRYFKRKNWIIHITGKWFNYGILLIVLLLDLNMWKNQIFYKPFDYGQYVGPEQRIYAVLDQVSLDHHNESILTYAWRSVNDFPSQNQSYTEHDMKLNCRFHDYHIALKALAFVPSMIAFVAFISLIFYFGRWKPTPSNPHAGRLKKRKRLTLWHRFRSSIRQSFRKRKPDEAAPNLAVVDVEPPDPNVVDEEIHGKQSINCL